MLSNVKNLHEIEQKLEREARAWTKQHHDITYAVQQHGDHAGAMIIHELHSALIGFVRLGDVSIAVYDKLLSMKLLSSVGKSYLTRRMEFPDEKGPLFLTKT